MKKKKQMVIPSNNRMGTNYPVLSPIPSDTTFTKKVNNLAVELDTTPSREEVAVLESLESTEKAK